MTEQLDVTEYLAFDLDDRLAAAEELLEHGALDETEFDAKQREKREQYEAKLAERAAKWRRGLTDVQSRRRVYRLLALRSRSLGAPQQHQLGDAACRVLLFLLELADNDLDNAFPSRATAAKLLGMAAGAYRMALWRLRRQGWIRTKEYFRRSDGTQSSSGIQFLVPPGILHPEDHAGWAGPATFSKRKRVAQKTRRRHGPSGVGP